jgi:hypothetical protein
MPDREHFDACVTTFLAVVQDPKKTPQRKVEAATDLKRAIDKMVDFSLPRLTLAERLDVEATEAGMDPEQLDNLVIDLKEKDASDDNNACDAGDEALDEDRIEARMDEASALNNEGLGAQIRYIIESLGDKQAEHEIRQSLEMGERCTCCRKWFNPKTMHLSGDNSDPYCDGCFDERLR